jgi:hypothetical protein
MSPFTSLFVFNPCIIITHSQYTNQAIYTGDCSNHVTTGRRQPFGKAAKNKEPTPCL